MVKSHIAFYDKSEFTKKEEGEEDPAISGSDSKTI